MTSFEQIGFKKGEDFVEIIRIFDAVDRLDGN